MSDTGNANPFNVNTKSSWQQELSNIVTDPAELWRLLQLDPHALPAAKAACEQFPLKVTHSYLARMQMGNRHDPLLKQVLPCAEELAENAAYVADPLEEAASNPVPGLLHKYPGRVLVTLTSACAVHCRYCFRRHFPYAENNPGRSGWEKMAAYIRADTNIKEVILSGGDPWSVSDALLQQFTQLLSDIPHLTTLRIHTRLPIALPNRVTEELCAWLKSLPWQAVVVIHCNHAQEINTEVRTALAALKATGAHLLNQSVLLQGVNDNVETLATLSETLFSAGVLPYYLHALDKVAGAWHFDTPESRAQALHADLLQRLPGYLVPVLAYEKAGALSKIRL